MITTFLLLSTLFGSGMLVDPVKHLRGPFTVNLNVKGVRPMTYNQSELLLFFSDTQGGVKIWLLISLHDFIEKMNQQSEEGKPYTVEEFMRGSKDLVVHCSCSYEHSGDKIDVKMETEFMLNRFVHEKNLLNACLDDKEILFVFDGDEVIPLKTFPAVFAGEREAADRLVFLIDATSFKPIDDHKGKLLSIEGSSGEKPLTYLLSPKNIDQYKIVTDDSEDDVANAKAKEQLWRQYLEASTYLTFLLPNDGKTEKFDTVNTNTHEHDQASVVVPAECNIDGFENTVR